MRRLTQKTVTATLGLALITMPLAGCFGGNNGTSETTDEVIEEELVDDSQRIPTGNPDYNTWTTLGDAFAAAEESPSYGCDSNYYIGSIVTGGKTIYVVAKLDSSLYEAFTDAETEEDAEATISKVQIAFKQDITDKMLSSEELNALVGKTGKELVDAGYVFSSYTMYGGDSTTASFDKDYYSYEITFDTPVPEDVAEKDDSGDAIKDAKVTEALIDPEITNLSNIAFDPTKFTMIPEVAATGLTPSPATDMTADDATAEGTVDMIATDASNVGGTQSETKA